MAQTRILITYHTHTKYYQLIIHIPYLLLLNLNPKKKKKKAEANNRLSELFKLLFI